MRRSKDRGAGSALVIGALAAALSCAVIRGAGGVDASEWNWTLLAVAIPGLFMLRSPRAPQLPRKLLWPGLLFVAYLAFQAVPLPRFVAGVLSPARARLAELASPMLAQAPFVSLSVAPAATARHFLRVLACLVVLFLVREVIWRNPHAAWKVALPVVLIACYEALIGILQVEDGHVAAHGDWVNRNHFAGFLGMALPLPLMHGIGVLKRRRSGGVSNGLPALIACAWFSAAALLLVGVLRSLSRMGFAASLIGVVVSLWVWTMTSSLRRRARAMASVLAVAGGLILFIFLPPDRLAARFSEIGFGEGVTDEDRAELWRASTVLIGEYPLFGCGFGGYESAFLRHKSSAALVLDDYVHNDYLQLLIEVGALGLALALSFALACVLQAARAARSPVAENRAVAAACMGAFAAIAVHSTVDFNLYIPANLMLLAWISGLAVSLEFRRPPAHRAHSPHGAEAPRITCNAA